MKSIINDVTRLEKGLVLFTRLVDSCSAIKPYVDIKVSGYLHECLLKSNAFIKKYGNDYNQICECGHTKNKHYVTQEATLGCIKCNCTNFTPGNNIHRVWNHALEPNYFPGEDD